MNSKALTRYFYSSVPGLAIIRFAAKDLLSNLFSKPEYSGVVRFQIGDGVIVDVGANRGQSIAAFRRLAPESRIIAFEPEPRSSTKLVSRYRREQTVTIHNCALGENSGSIAFFVPTYGRWNCDGMSATTYDEATQWLQDPGRMLLFNRAKLKVDEYTIECRALDSFGLSPRLIKLHAQGAEHSILKGAQQTIWQHRPAMMCAFPQRAVTELLADWDYSPYTYRDSRFIPGVAEQPVTFTWYLMADHIRQLSTRP
jgi:FkbM family methyltransferase